MIFSVYSILTLILLYVFFIFIKYIDEENELPIKLSVEFIIFALLSGGFNMYFDDAWLMTFFYAFLLIEAYTDYHTMQLYLIFSVSAALIGYLYMIIFGHITLDICFDIIVFFLIVGISRFIKAINTGDVWLLFASVPYILNVFNFKDSLLILVGFYVLTLFLGLFINVKDILFKKKQYVPYAVPFCLGYCCLLIFKLIERSNLGVYI